MQSLGAGDIKPGVIHQVDHFRQIVDDGAAIRLSLVNGKMKILQAVMSAKPSEAVGMVGRSEIQDSRDAQRRHFFQKFFIALLGQTFAPHAVFGHFAQVGDPKFKQFFKINFFHKRFH